MSRHARREVRPRFRPCLGGDHGQVFGVPRLDDGHRVLGLGVWIERLQVSG